MNAPPRAGSSKEIIVIFEILHHNNPKYLFVILTSSGVVVLKVWCSFVSLAVCQKCSVWTQWNKFKEKKRRINKSPSVPSMIHATTPAHTFHQNCVINAGNGIGRLSLITNNSACGAYPILSMALRWLPTLLISE